MTFQPRSADGRFAEKTGSPAEVSLAAETDWRDQRLVVYGVRRTLGEVHGGKLYHGSARDLAIGTVLEPQETRNFKQSAADAVSITSDEQTAAYWPREALGDQRAEVFIYEVEPIGKVEAWRVSPANYGKNIRLDEGRVPTARIIGKKSAPRL